MLLSKLPDQKQDPSTEVPQPQSSSAESSPPQEWPLVGVSLLFLHDAVDHVRIGFEPAGQTEGSQNRSIIPSQKQLTAIVSVNCCGRRSIAEPPATLDLERFRSISPDTRHSDTR